MSAAAVAVPNAKEATGAEAGTEDQDGDQKDRGDFPAPPQAHARRHYDGGYIDRLSGAVGTVGGPRHFPGSAFLGRCPDVPGDVFWIHRLHLPLEGLNILGERSEPSAQADEITLHTGQEREELADIPVQGCTA